MVLGLSVPPLSVPGTRASALSTIIVIPARYHSTRLPGKVLSDIAGQPMIERVYRRASQAGASAVVVATDDERVRDVVEGFGGRALMTSERHQSGTDRLAEAIRFLEADIIVNVQADEPLIEPAMIDEAVAALGASAEVAIGTLRKAIDDNADLANPNVVKVAAAPDGRALYFSRAPIPYARDGRRTGPAWRHIGIYAYRREALLTLAALPPAPLEQTESLEQLRALEHGFIIQTRETTYDTIGVDTPEDLERVRRLMSGVS
ncbi:MAG TPA: 3-deoxy-manno-octulosonate cytidylyltransferase [Vicinamibacterales bacterium]|nr:3-deoxy-manno-octulosonate cytidylyltransferase [Vicinamibacterales bacterium]